MIPPLASRFVAGESPDGALDHVASVNERGVNAIVNLLGEYYEDRDDVSQDIATYRQLIDTIDEESLSACISVKPTQLGLTIDEELFLDRVSSLAGYAADRSVFLWLDMEDHTTTDMTLEAYERLARETNGGVGVCVQSNLKRTAADVERLSDLPGKVRFVKGAYNEPDPIAYPDGQAVDRELKRLLDFAFETFDDGIALGSHDPEMIDHAQRLHAEFGTPYELQMLMGVRTDRQFELAREGVDVWQYVPFGDKWLSYFYRRLRERRRNITFALRAILNR